MINIVIFFSSTIFLGRPIVKGNGISNQFAANDFPQAFLMGV